MENSNASILHHFYGLLIEMNFHRPELDMFAEKDFLKDPFIRQHQRQIKLLSAKYKAEMNKNRYTELLKEIKRLKEIGFDEIKKFLKHEEAMQFQPLFRKFENLSQADEASIANDGELLQMIVVLKDKLDKPNNE